MTNETTGTLDTISIATPCSADWNAMSGDDRARFCGQCSLTVYNLSAMSRAEAEAFVTEREGRVCVRFYRRADGTMLTQDCPVGLRAIRPSTMRRLRSMIAAGTALLAIVSGPDAWSTFPIMGKMVRPVDETTQPAQTAEPDQPQPDQAQAPADSSAEQTVEPEDEGMMIMGGLMPPVEMGEMAAPVESDPTQVDRDGDADLSEPGPAVCGPAEGHDPATLDPATLDPTNVEPAPGGDLR